MAQSPAAMWTEVRDPAVKAILLGGLIAGALDISDAFILWGIQGVSPVRILQSIAAGLLGREALQGGLTTAALGAFLHFFMTTMMAAAYYIAARRLPLLVRHAVVCGARLRRGALFLHELRGAAALGVPGRSTRPGSTAAD